MVRFLCLSTYIQPEEKMEEGKLRSRLTIVLDGQYGSCGKGAYAQWLAAEEKPALALRTGGPNAGHSVITPRGVVALRHIPAACVECPETTLALPGAALLNVDVLREEIAALREIGVEVEHRLVIDPLATVITHTHEKAEADLRDKIGSTREGVGAAQAEKIMRRAPIARDFRELQKYLGDVTSLVNSHIDEGNRVHVEMTQGAGLGLHFGHYPFATSRDITPAQAFNDISASPSHPGLDLRVHMLARTYPIRVAGNSGPMLGGEILWEELSRRTRGYVQVERTTVTKLPRRIANWSSEEVLRAATIVRPTLGVLMFLDYLQPELGKAAQAAWKDRDYDMLQQIESEVHDLFYAGVLDKYREPFKATGSDIGAVSLGFGVLFKTPAWEALQSNRELYY